MTRDEISAVQVGKIMQAVDTITTATEKFTAVIYDRDGLIERTAKIEQAALALEKEKQADAEFRKNTAKQLDRIEASVNAHHADKELHTFKGLVFKRDILAGLLLAVIFIHTLIPPDANMWEIIKKLAGI